MADSDSDERDAPIASAELERMLRAFEGPPQPVPRPFRARTRAKWLRLALLALAAAAAIAATIAALRDEREPAWPALTPGVLCTAALDFGGKRYAGRSLGGGRLPLGDPLGHGRARCAGGGSAGVEVRRIEGIDPAIAVAPRGAAKVVFVAAGRCRGLERVAILLRCLRT